jgi:hypothetical protein
MSFANYAIFELTRIKSILSHDKELFEDDIQYIKRGITQLKDRKKGPNFVCKEILEDCLVCVTSGLNRWPINEYENAYNRQLIRKKQLEEGLNIFKF